MNFVEALTETFRQNRNPDNIADMERYMKNRFHFAGVKSVERKMLLKAIYHEIGVPTMSELPAITQQLWNAEYRELHYCCQELLEKKKYFKEENAIELFKWMVETNSWWDTVDFIAAKLVGGYFKFHPEKEKDMMLNWNQSSNMWLVRTTLLYQLKYKQATDFVFLKTLILPHIESNEFFIQKAIGWALREYAKTNAQPVLEFVEQTHLKPLSHREALKHF